MPKRVEIRDARGADIAVILTLGAGNLSASWNLASFEKELESPVARLRVASCGPVVGFAHFWHVGDEVQLMNIATAPASRRQGIARALMIDMFNIGVQKHAERVTLEVRVSNVAAIALYESLGFSRQSVRKAYYVDNGEDALMMFRQLSSRKITVFP